MLGRIAVLMEFGGCQNPTTKQKDEFNTYNQARL